MGKKKKMYHLKILNYLEVKTVPDDTKTSVKSYMEFVVEHAKNFFDVICLIFSDSHIRKWSLWWALTTSGDLQVNFY